MSLYLKALALVSETVLLPQGHYLSVSEILLYRMGDDSSGGKH